MTSDGEARISADAAEEIKRLYAEAFRDFKTIALWNMRALENPTAEDALVVARALRFEGNMESRRLAERIEALARAAD